ncbi:MAG: gamma-glutamyl-gamma-aminobutyrate hydrolase family protein, partial [Pseudomonadota bacterium]
MPESRKPLIGISCHLAEQAGANGRTQPFHRLAAQYARAIKDAGGLPVLLSAHALLAAEPEELPHRLDGILLSGGTDLPAGAFTRLPNPLLREIDPDRYDYEVKLVREARRQGLPLVGICRGHQTLAEALGGKLILNLEGSGRRNHYQDLPAEVPSHEISNHGLLADRLG